VSAGTHQVDGAVTGSKSTAITPLLATGQLPADHLPSVTVRPLPGGIGAGSPVAVEVVADEGEHWFRDQPGEPDSEPIVTYAGTTRTLEDSTVVGSAFHRRRRRRRDLPPPGRHRLTASCTTDTGGRGRLTIRRRAGLADDPPVLTVRV
jgi:hypothetical protein